MSKIPILLITFNRPNHTQKVLETIIAAQPQDLYVFQDGARTGADNDIQKCELVRKHVEQLTKNTPIKLHTYYSDTNLGCGAGPMTAITWFFGQVERGIVMEDDCLPHPDFFDYCQELLERYQNNPQVLFINATLYNNRWKCKDSYDFSHYMVTGAWAGWKRTWEGFDLDLTSVNALKLRKHILNLTHNRGEANWWYAIVKEIQQDKSKKSYWDYQMQIHLFRNNALTIHPQRNLISNIGFDGEGTHTLDNNNNRGGKPVFPIMPLTHPSSIAVDVKRDALCWAKGQSQSWAKDLLTLLYNHLLWSSGPGHYILMKYKQIRGKNINTKKV